MEVKNYSVISRARKGKGNEREVSQRAREEGRKSKPREAHRYKGEVKYGCNCDNLKPLLCIMRTLGTLHTVSSAVKNRTEREGRAARTSSIHTYIHTQPTRGNDDDEWTCFHGCGEGKCCLRWCLLGNITPVTRTQLSPQPEARCCSSCKAS